MLKKILIHFKNQRGFTLVEMLVTALIFSIIIGTTVGVFVSVIRIQRYNLTYHQLLAQTSYAIEYMARAIRMAKKESPALGCLSSDTLNYERKDIPTTSIPGLMFRNYKGVCKGFFLQDGQLKEYEKGRTDPILPLTSANFDLISLGFEVTGESDSDTLQPRVTVFMEIRGEGSAFQPGPRIRIQTTISQRNLDI